MTPAILFNQLGEVHVLLGEGQLAEAPFLEAIKRNDKLAQSWFNLAVLYEERGQIARPKNIMKARCPDLKHISRPCSI